MSQPEASLATLPTELMRVSTASHLHLNVLLSIIFPHPSDHSVSIDKVILYEQEWLAIRHNWREIFYGQHLGYLRVAGPHYTMRDLRALSQTCRSLRNYTLPLLWAVVHVKTVSELSRLAKALREAPYIAPLIRNFTFMWKMNGDVSSCSHHPKEHGSLLDLAFVDRGAEWERARKACNADIEFQAENTGRPNTLFQANGQRFFAPGHAPVPLNFVVDDRELPSLTSLLQPEFVERVRRLEAVELARRLREPGRYLYHWPYTNASGPDGNGPDYRIHNADDFNKCLGEVIAQLSSLEVLTWNSEVAPMPLSVIEALKLASRLRTLSIDMITKRSTFHDLPYWECAGTLSNLSIHVPCCYNPFMQLRTELIETEETSEEELTSFELPSAPTDGTPEAEQKLRCSIAFRMIIAAAKGGNLRSLYLHVCHGFQKPFSVRSLLPYWVGVEVWRGWQPNTPSSSPMKDWVGAATSLRTALAHASLWLPESTLSSRKDRRLTREDVQGLHAFFGVQQFACRTEAIYEDNFTAPQLLVELYLPWLAEDAELAKKVAEAWNAVVSRGEADRVRCYCEMCQSR